MFRITVVRAPRGLVLKLEGRCSAEVVGELQDAWRTASALVPAHQVWLDVAGVSSIDAAGRRQLSDIHRAGANFVPRGCFARDVIRDICELP